MRWWIFDGNASRASLSCIEGISWILSMSNERVLPKLSFKKFKITNKFAKATNFSNGPIRGRKFRFSLNFKIPLKFETWKCPTEVSGSKISAQLHTIASSPDTFALILFESVALEEKLAPQVFSRSFQLLREFPFWLESAEPIKSPHIIIDSLEYTSIVAESSVK